MTHSILMCDCVMHQDYKTLNFGMFFGETRDLCFSRFGKERGSQFFDLLVSQMTQRLLKAAADKQAKGKLNTQNLALFIDALVASGERSKEESSERHAVAVSLQLILDQTSVPEKVLEANECIGQSDHWLAKAFALENGRKVLKQASEHADSRGSVNKILLSLEEVKKDLDGSVRSIHDGGLVPRSFGSQKLGN